ncbi:hypothetical protein VCR26J2_370570 [Vibrio coralliirubri]|nr:hypothetical protein VCR1J2_200228 [Vibrio coralliirubri]CDT14169.1 hypothetical protein VCR4J2_250638 [Vibrio coralliirubri]CDT76861.1 hypothetical protein VCR8J2_190514 [Vibrio coralliirubri]CDT78621.1 hypothetical protein VCR26J2_370570 [Vibrio coralliirubri]
MHMIQQFYDRTSVTYFCKSTALRRDILDKRPETNIEQSKQNTE